MTEELQHDGEDQPHLLLVDDDPTFTRVMARAMSRRGLHVSIAGSAEEGLEMARQETPDYAVLDLKMEGDSGLVLLPKLLELDPEMKVLILTGYSSIATAVEAIKRGACNYLCKPADADDVLAALLSRHADLDTLVPENPMSVDRLQWEHSVLLQVGLGFTDPTSALSLPLSEPTHVFPCRSDAGRYRSSICDAVPWRRAQAHWLDR